MSNIIVLGAGMVGRTMAIDLTKNTALPFPILAKMLYKNQNKNAKH